MPVKFSRDSEDFDKEEDLMVLRPMIRHRDQLIQTLQAYNVKLAEELRFYEWRRREMIEAIKKFINDVDVEKRYYLTLQQISDYIETEETIKVLKHSLLCVPQK